MASTVQGPSLNPTPVTVTAPVQTVKPPLPGQTVTSGPTLNPVPVTVTAPVQTVQPPTIGQTVDAGPPAPAPVPVSTTPPQQDATFFTLDGPIPQAQDAIYHNVGALQQTYNMDAGGGEFSDFAGGSTDFGALDRVLQGDEFMQQFLESQYGEDMTGPLIWLSTCRR